MGIPGFSAGSALYRSKMNYRTRREMPTACVDAGKCTLTASPSELITAFRARVADLTLAGEGRADPRGPEKRLSLNINRGGETVLKFESNLSASGSFSQTWHYGPMVKGVREARLVTRDGKRIEGTINGRRLTSFTPEAQSLTFADGSPVPQPIFPPAVGRGLQQVPTAIRGVLATCRPTPEIEGAYSPGIPPRSGVANSFLSPAITILSPAITKYGVPGRFDDTGSQSSCHNCILEAYAAAAGCGAACGFSFGIACACIEGIPSVFANCHSPGTGLGQGCCPVGCGPTQGLAGVGVVFQCCSSGDSCLNSTTGTCCEGGFQPCNQSTCCPSSAPCRDGSICCPTNHVTCITAKGPVCCDQGEDCIQNVGCCPPGNVCGNECCGQGEVCTQNGGCCPPSNVCGNNCCSSSSRCVDANTGNCCPELTGIPCGNQCCNASTQRCTDAGCCSIAQACGGTCCPAGSICDASGQCTSGCPDGEDFSTAPDGTVTCCPLYQCDNPSNDNICVENSCPGGVCCGQNQVCCPGDFPGQYSCSDPPCIPPF